MIGRLTGVIVHDEADGTLLVDVGGVGYEVLAPLGTTGRLGTPPVVLHVHTHVREDTLQLFGFATADDRTTFRTLLGISNVGPRMALAILSSLPGGELARVIGRQELARLTAIPGVGKKTAERLLLELRDKLTPGVTTGRTAALPNGTAMSVSPSARDLLSGALTRMGYKAAEAERAIQELGERVEKEALGDLVRDALALLVRLQRRHRLTGDLQINVRVCNGCQGVKNENTEAAKARARNTDGA